MAVRDNVGDLPTHDHNQQPRRIIRCLKGFVGFVLGAPYESLVQVIAGLTAVVAMSRGRLHGRHVGHRARNDNIYAQYYIDSLGRNRYNRIGLHGGTRENGSSLPGIEHGALAMVGGVPLRKAKFASHC